MGIEIGKQIKNLRTAKGVTQEELANYLGISYQAVSKWENDLTSPDIQLLPILSVYFGITIDKLFEMQDKTHMERIENMLENDRVINEETFIYAENFLEKMLKENAKNARVYFLLAQLYNHKAKNSSERAADYAKQALMYEPYTKDNHWALGVATNAYCGDFHANSHYALINYYQDFVEKHPSYWSGYLYLLDQLIADGRYDEAKTALKQVKKLKESYVYYYYEGDIELALGNYDKAVDLFNQGVEDYPEVWQVYLQRGDRLVKLGKYAEAIIDYEMAFEKQEKPRYTDAFISMAQVYEILGQYDKAIEVIKRQITLLNEEHHIVTGETVDEPMREIERLNKLLK